MFQLRLWKWLSKKRYIKTSQFDDFFIRKHNLLFIYFQFLRKVQRQERIVEEIKLLLKPHYNRKRINKEDYKEILRKCVPKVSFSCYQTWGTDLLIGISICNYFCLDIDNFIRDRDLSFYKYCLNQVNYHPLICFKRKPVI